MLPGAFTGNADCDAGISGFCHVLVTPSLVAQEVKRLSVMWETWVRKIRWRRKWQPTPVLLPGKFHGWRNLVGYSPWGCKELDTTEQLHFTSMTPSADSL